MLCVSVNECKCTKKDLNCGCYTVHFACLELWIPWKGQTSNVKCFMRPVVIVMSSGVFDVSVSSWGVGGWCLTKLAVGCDSRDSTMRTRQVEFTSGRKDMMSSSVTAPLTCGGGRNMEAGQFGIQRLKSNWRTQRGTNETQTGIGDAYEKLS